MPPQPRLNSSGPEDWPLPTRIAAVYARLRDGLDERIRHYLTPDARAVSWAERLWTTPQEDLAREASDGVHRSVQDELHAPVLQAHKVLTGRYRGLAWYGQQDAHWLAHYELWHKVVGLVYAPEELEQLEIWAALARSCGWWWPDEETCVVSERPVELHTEPAGDQGEVRLHAADGPAVRYADNWSVYSWHGTRVPHWVMTGPTAERIAAEPNVEVRRCAIERIGWDAYLDQAGLALVASALDPGNHGSELRLYDMPSGFGSRVLLAVNGSAERDGRRRVYGLTVPARFDDPIAAAGWTYGLPAAQYSELVRRT